MLASDLRALLDDNLCSCMCQTIARDVRLVVPVRFRVQVHFHLVASLAGAFAAFRPGVGD